MPERGGLPWVASAGATAAEWCSIMNPRTISSAASPANPRLSKPVLVRVLGGDTVGGGTGAAGAGAGAVGPAALADALELELELLLLLTISAEGGFWKRTAWFSITTLRLAAHMIPKCLSRRFSASNSVPGDRPEQLPLIGVTPSVGWKRAPPARSGHRTPTVQRQADGRPPTVSKTPVLPAVGQVANRVRGADQVSEA